MERPTAGAGYPPNGVVEGEWDPDDGPMDLMAAAAALGARAWVERELHVLVGGWVTDAEHPAAVVAFDGIAMRHAWRGEVLLSRLPQLRELPTDRVVTSPGPVTDELLSALRGLADDGSRIGAWAEVGRSLAEAYASLLDRTGPVADAPLQRWLPLLLDSIRGDLELVSVPRPGDGDERIGTVAALVRDAAGMTR